MKPEFYYPQDTWNVTQKWGVHRPEIYGRFGFTQHNGVDTALAPNKLIKAPFPCVVHKIGFQPNGGGIYLSILSQEAYEWEDGKKAWVLWDFLHLEKTSVPVGAKHDTASVLATGDNTGFSTGPHTHHQCRRVLSTPDGLIDVDINDANNSFDPEPYFVGYPKDFLEGALVRAYKQLAQLLAQLLKALVKKPS